MTTKHKKICYCKKDFRFRNDIDFMFFAGSYYEHYLEDDGDFFWVIYNENGDTGHQGCRFHNKKKDFKKIGNCHAFYEYFETGRLMKLKKLNLICNES